MEYILAIILDIFCALLLSLVCIILSPLHMLRGSERMLTFIRVLMPYGLLTTGLRTMLDWRLGHNERVISQVEGMIGYLEDARPAQTGRLSRRRVLADLYALMARAYLQGGHVDDAMLVIIRASNNLGVGKLRGLAELDARTAHIIRAGIAAGRLLDTNGLATVMVRSSQDKSKYPKSRHKKSRRQKTREGSKRQGASFKDLGAMRPDSKKQTESTESEPSVAESEAQNKVIPFPISP